MRLIDADALIPKIKFIGEAEAQIYGRGSWGFTAKCLSEIDEAPTIEPERTGRWINGKCDQCGGDAPYWPMASTYYESDFCQHCGSPMEVERE